MDLVGGRCHDRQGYKPLPSFFPKRVSFFGPPCAIQAIRDLADIDGRHETLKTLPAGSLPEESLGDVSSRFILQPGEQGKRVKTDAHDAPHPHGQPQRMRNQKQFHSIYSMLFEIFQGRIKIFCHPVALVFGATGLARPQRTGTTDQAGNRGIVLSNDEFFTMEQVVDQISQLSLSFLNGNSWHGCLLRSRSWYLLQTSSCRASNAPALITFESMCAN